MNKSEFLNKLVTENDLDKEEDLFPLPFKKGGKIEYMRSVGKYRLRWNDNDLTN